MTRSMTGKVTKLRLSDAEGIAEATQEAGRIAKLLQTALSYHKQAE